MAGFFPASTFKTPATSRVPRCGACGLYRGCKSPKLEVAGGGKRKLLIVGSAPSAADDKRGEFFSDDVGTLLKSELINLDIDVEEDCWVTNALICHPPKGGTEDQVDHCRPNLVKILETLKPVGVLLLGKHAIDSFMPMDTNKIEEASGGVAKWEGWRIPSQQRNAWIVPTMHPGSMPRNRMDDPSWIIWRRALARFAAIADHPWDVVPDYRSRCEIIYDGEQAAAALDAMMDSEYVAWDYETTMLKPEGPQASIYSCSYSDGETTFAAPWSRPLLAKHLEFINDKEVKKIASNLKFEDRWSRQQLGFHVRGWAWDTMVNAHILDHRRGINSIKFQCYVLLGQPDYDSSISGYLKSGGPHQPNRIHEADLGDLLLYNAMDSLLEFLAAAEQAEQVGLHPRLCNASRALRPRKDLLLDE